MDDLARLTEVANRYALRGPFILAVGTIEPRKNYERLIQAFAMIHGNPQCASASGDRGAKRLDVYECVRDP